MAPAVRSTPETEPKRFLLTFSIETEKRTIGIAFDHRLNTQINIFENMIFRNGEKIFDRGDFVHRLGQQSDVFLPGLAKDVHVFQRHFRC